MTVVLGILLVLHLLGWAIVLGGSLAAMRSPRLVPGMLHGILTALVTGIAMTGLHESGALGSGDDEKLVMAKIAVKLVVALAVTALIVIGTRQPSKVTTRFLGAVAGLTTLNVAIAVLWS